jgi:hypothetical protein
MPVPDPALSLAVVLALLVVLMADDLIPGLEADDVAIPPLLARLAKILAN